MLSTREVAERLSVSEASVRRWSDRGLLPVQRVGKRRERRFRLQDVEARQADLRASIAPVQPAPGRILLGGSAVEIPFHLAAFYDSDGGRVRLTAPFLAEGIKTGQPSYLLAQGEELSAYFEAFERAGIDVDEALSQGQLTVLGSPGRTVVQALDYWEKSLWSAMDHHATFVRVVGEMVSERENFDSESEMLAYEAAFNQTARRFPCGVICQYDVRRFSGRAILQALRAHPDILQVSLSLLLK